MILSLKEVISEATSQIDLPIIGSYKNGNHYTIMFSDGTKYKQTINRDDVYFTYDFPENWDIKITDFCDYAYCSYCHEGSSPKGEHGNLKALEPMIKSLQSGTEAAIGGGNALSHPDLIWFLERLKEQGVIANITINQNHLKPYKDMICKIVGDGLVYGIGISLTDSSKMDEIEFASSLGDNVVFHTIAGILSPKDVNALVGKKVLILGYKDLRRGASFKEKESEKIERNIKWLQMNLPILSNVFKLISFDCLGIEQINPKAVLKMSDDEYNLLFQGADNDALDSDGNITCCTMYIDVPNMKIGRSSTQPLADRHNFTGSEHISELLKMSTIGF